MRLCPKCKSPTLAPLGLRSATAESTPPSRCTHCKGVWLPHEAVEAHLSPPAQEAELAAAPEADRLPGFCPQDHNLLTRAPFEADRSFHLDRCPICRGVWFDAGEWATVASTQWLSHLDDLWDPIWRKRMREHRALNRQIETLEHALGPEVHRKVMAALEALRRHRNRSLALSFLIEELRGPE